jgi:hypothetical protein
MLLTKFVSHIPRISSAFPKTPKCCFFFAALTARLPVARYFLRFHSLVNGFIHLFFVAP